MYSQNPTVQKSHPIILFQWRPSIVKVQLQCLTVFLFWYWLFNIVTNAVWRNSPLYNHYSPLIFPSFLPYINLNCVIYKWCKVPLSVFQLIYSYYMIYTHLISLWKWWSIVLIRSSSCTLIESLFWWLSEADCENKVSVTCHEKYTQSFNTPKHSIENV